jgi:hypothetical protein
MTAIGKDFYKSIVIGDFPKLEAKQFLIFLLETSSIKDASVSDEAWDNIHKVNLLLYRIHHTACLQCSVAVLTVAPQIAIM